MLTETDNLGDRLESGLPPELLRLLRKAGELSGVARQRIYLVGGIVRDLLLGRPNLDLDLVVEGDAIDLARRLAGEIGGKATFHPRFGTATVRFDTVKVDLAMARSETYARPGALPAVTPGDLRSDLFRRDFSINAMAVALDPARFGEVIDLYGSRRDLENRLIRVLHEKSFSDDATRIWRAIRYEQRLDFAIEPVTLGLLRRDIPMLDTISGDRIRHEIERALMEARPEKALRRASGLGVMGRVHAALAADDWLADRYAAARRHSAPEIPSPALYLALLAYCLAPEQVSELVEYLHLPGPLARTVRDTVSARVAVVALTDPLLPPSRVYSALHGFAVTALAACRLGAESPVVRDHISLYLARWRFVRPLLNGDSLVALGIPRGPKLGVALKRLLQARLDGQTRSREDETALAKALLSDIQELSGD